LVLKTFKVGFGREIGGARGNVIYQGIFPNFIGGHQGLGRNWFAWLISPTKLVYSSNYRNWGQNFSLGRTGTLFSNLPWEILDPGLFMGLGI